MRALQSRRNALLPVSQLPSEVLCRIFEHVAPSDLSYEWDLRWIVFSHVSRHWRDTALECASLWRCIPTTGPTELTREFLRRSKSAPLAVVVPYPMQWNRFYHTADPPEGVPLAFEELGRIVTLNFTASRSCDLNFFEDYHGATAPMLETLRIMGDGSSASDTLLLDPIFLAGTSRLQRLETRGIGLKWPLSLPPTLTSLTLAGGSARASRPTEPQLYDMIRSLDHLKYLSLQGTLPVRESNAKPVIQHLLLKDLWRLEVIDDADCCAAFLQHVAVPDDCSLSIKYSDYRMGNEALTALATAAVIDHYRKSRKSRERSGLLVAVRFTVELNRFEFQEIWFDHSRGAAGAPIQSQENSVFHIELSLGVREADMHDQMRTILGALLWDDVQRFEVAGTWGLEDVIIRNMTVPLAHVDTVHATACAATAILKILYQSKAAERPAEQPDLFPALRVLVLTDVSLGAPRDPPPDVPEDGQMLLEILSAGHNKIRKVILRLCSHVLPALFTIPGVEVEEGKIDSFEMCVYASHTALVVLRAAWLTRPSLTEQTVLSMSEVVLCNIHRRRRREESGKCHRVDGDARCGEG